MQGCIILGLIIEPTAHFPPRKIARSQFFSGGGESLLGIPLFLSVQSAAALWSRECRS